MDCRNEAIESGFPPPIETACTIAEDLKSDIPKALRLDG
jgi:hypothetical protein